MLQGWRDTCGHWPSQVAQVLHLMEPCLVQCTRVDVNDMTIVSWPVGHTLIMLQHSHDTGRYCTCYQWRNKRLRNNLQCDWDDIFLTEDVSTQAKILDLALPSSNITVWQKITNIKPIQNRPNKIFPWWVVDMLLYRRLLMMTANWTQHKPSLTSSCTCSCLSQCRGETGWDVWVHRPQPCLGPACRGHPQTWAAARLC